MEQMFPATQRIMWKQTHTVSMLTINTH